MDWRAVPSTPSSCISSSSGALVGTVCLKSPASFPSSWALRTSATVTYSAPANEPEAGGENSTYIVE